MFQICQNESCGFLLVPDALVLDVFVPDVFIPRVPLSRWAMTTGMLQATPPETMLHCETFRASVFSCAMAGCMHGCNGNT
jgi:hypothetical protein